jgi:AraC family transcriptional regulator, transcriptional activator of pobA
MLVAMVSPRNVPIHPITDYGPGMSAGEQFFVGRFEQSVTSRPNRLRFHRHTYYEVFWINGNGSFFADFREYCITSPTLIFVSPGQVHRWNQKPRLTGPMICFTQEFYDGKEPPPSSLLDLPFWFPFETPPLLTIDGNQAVTFDSLWNDLEAEATLSKERDDVARALLRLLFYKAARIYRSLYEEGGTQSAEGEQSRIGRDFRLAVEKHFRTITSVSDYAKSLHVTADHLGAVVRGETGRTPGDIIRERLLLEAKRLLVHTSMNVSEIAYALNFEDPAYFSRFFRRLTDKAPGDFREESSEKHQT